MESKKETCPLKTFSSNYPTASYTIVHPGNMEKFLLE